MRFLTDDFAKHLSNDDPSILELEEDSQIPVYARKQLGLDHPDVFAFGFTILGPLIAATLVT